MGCFESKPLETPSKPVRQPAPQAVPPPAAPPVQQPVLNVARPEVSYGEREKNELKVKNMRDKLQTTVATCEQVLRDDARLAVQMRRQGNDASARVLVHRRRLTKRKIVKSEAMLVTVMEMLDSMDQAKDNVKLVEAMERGTAAINDIMKDLSVERVQNALADSHEAVEYTREVGEMIAGSGEAMTDAEFDDAMAQLDREVAASVVVAPSAPPAPPAPPAAEMAAPSPPAQPAAAAVAPPAPELQVQSLTEEAQPVRQAVETIPQLPTAVPASPAPAPAQADKGEAPAEMRQPVAS